MFSEKGVLRNFTKFTRKHLSQSLFFNKVIGLRPAKKKRLWDRYFPVNFLKFLRTPFLTEHLWWMLLQLLFKLQILDWDLDLQKLQEWLLHKNFAARCFVPLKRMCGACMQRRIQKIQGAGDLFQKWAQKSVKCFYVEVLQI